MATAPRRPRPLREGDLVALCAPSSGVEPALFPRLERAIARLQQRGLRVREGQTLRREHKQCSAPADERAAELQSFLLDPEVAAVMPPWGGERAIELLPLLDFERLAAAEPKWFSGFSDLSTLQLPLALRASWMSLHGPNLMELGAEALDPTTAALWPTLFDAAPPVQRASERWQAKGPDWRDTPGANLNLTETTRWRRLDGGTEPLHLCGRLIGGCLDTLGRIAGTAYGDLRGWRGQAGIGPHLLFLENCEMAPCELLRALCSLRLHGWFDGAAGLLIGRHAPAAVTAPERLSHEEAVRDALAGLEALPVLIDADIGHVPPQLSLIQGESAELRWAPGMPVELHQGPAI
ncbi:LD-carboxypeptidase [Roseateles sp. DAIF2]|uniref:S66 family peptidase n=1 Tax=Roseateles sp. DAIF2 TaxID=2714952 RepID=UPI0018A2C2B1|nr:S66 peptidase family protein [Roseateles sp. DAIF2]QPF72842.1 LD-carboxypeptidase [Roseateles sp. DAIF2]